MWRFGGIHHVQCVRLRSVVELWFDRACVSRSAGHVCVCALTTKLEHIIPKSQAGRLLQNIHTSNCYLHNIFCLSSDLMLSSICRSHTLYKKQYVVAQLHEIDVGWFIKNNKQIKIQ